jgi:ribose transport system substrate-binding protein
MKIQRFIPLCCLSGLLLAGCNWGSDKNTYHIAVIPKGTNMEFWKSVHAGALKAAEEQNQGEKKVRITWKGPLREDDREQQIQVVEGFVSQGVHGVVLAPLDSRALVRPVEEAKQAGIPTVIIDSALDSKNTLSFVATDNFRSGEIAAGHLSSLLFGKGKVVLLRYQEGSASTAEREEGFLSKLKSHHPGITVLSSDQYAGATRETAKRAAENLLQRLGNELQGIFCPNETTTAGTLLALQDAQKAGKVFLIGFDATRPFLEALGNGHIQGLIVQNPYKMGYLGVKTMIDHLQGKPVSNRIDTGVVMVTAENRNSPDIQELIHPPVYEK